MNEHRVEERILRYSEERHIYEELAKQIESLRRKLQKDKYQANSEI